MDELRDKLRGGKGAFKGVRPYDSWSGLIRRFVYALVQDLRSSGQLNTIKEVVRILPNEPLSVKFEENPFYWALYAAKIDGEIPLSNKDVSRFGMQMLYADRHDISPEVLVGFVYQQGSESELARKLKSNLNEGYRGSQARW